MSDSDAPLGARRSRPDRAEVVSVVLLGAAAILTAFAAFRAAIEDSASLEAYTESNRLATEATDLNGLGDVQQATDERLFLEWTKAVNTDDTDLAEYIRTSLMREELQAAVAWWAEAPDDVVTPFVEENPAWTNPYWDEAATVKAASEERFEAASAANEASDTLQLATVFFAVTLFFGGVANVFHNRRLQVVVLSVAGVALLVGAVVLVGARP